MSAFLSPLRIELLQEVANEYRGAWRLTAPLIYHSKRLGEYVEVPAGFVTDFESCPRVPVLFFAFGEIVHSPAVIHDWLYTAPAPCSRAEADAVLREACIAVGVPRWRAWGVWAGVRIGGAPRFNKP